MSIRLLELCGARPGHALLDIGTGHGEPALSAARIVGRDGRVVGIDLAPEMIDVARTRASDAGLPWVEFEVQNAESLDFPNGAFAAAVCRLSLMFVPDVPKALAEIHRVLRPGGRFAAAVCGPIERAPQWNLTIAAIAGELGVVPPPPPVLGEPGVFGLADPALLERLFRSAGFDDVRVAAEELVWEFVSPEELATWHTINPTIVGLLADQPPARRRAAWDAVVERARACADPDGRVRFPNQVLYAVGARPGSLQNVTASRSAS